ncbi:MAG: hypothetical protein E7294_10645 [Lachnospiraceae bacterium]|nr:hypothetical protein [Lachnospiraceae bacterium]
MFFDRNRKKKAPLEQKLKALQMHFENNYKDNAHQAYKESLEIFDQLKAEGILSAKEEAAYQKRMDEFAEKLKGYTHYDHIGW